MRSHTYPNLDAIPIVLDHLVLTANQRLALRIRESYDHKQLKQGLSSWQTPTIIAFNTWLQQLCYDTLDNILLNGSQVQYLWEQIIRESCPDDTLLNPAETAATAASAWEILHLWQVPISALESDPNQEVALFYQWALQFEVQCQQQRWITNAELPSCIIKQNLSRLPRQITLVGFDAFPPAIQALFESLQQDHEIESIQIEKQAINCYKTTAHDQDAEITLMAQWAKQLYDQDQNLKIGCIIPNLEKQRRVLFNTFTQIFDSEAMLPGNKSYDKKFNISAGQPLTQFNVIDVALQICNWLSGEIDIDIFAAILQSPYIQRDPLEQDYAAKLDLALRELNEQQLTFETIFQITPSLKALTLDDPDIIPIVQRLYLLNQHIRTKPNYASLSQWRQYFYHALEIMQWPGYRILNSEEYQICVRWQRLLDEYLQYDLVCRQNISFSHALYLLSKLTANTIFQSEGSHAPVQILGVLEAAGNNFDYMWVMGLDDETWPAAASPNPFIPYQMQKELQMPHATAERERFYTEQMMHRLTHSASHILFSYPQFDGDKLKSPSQFLKDIPHTDIATAPSTTHQTVSLERLDDDIAPKLTDNEAVKGGAWILKQQADCPFKAFAKVRLNAEAPQQPYFGLSPYQRGNLTHDVLERIWHKLKHQTALIQLNEPQRLQLIQQIVDAVIADEQHPTDSAFKCELLTLEAQRLNEVINEWLTFECERPHFSVVATEKPQNCDLGSIRFTARIDRIDTLEDGQQIIIDYKTNRNQVNSWFGDRPTDLQLPLYASLIPQASQISFAEVRPKQCQFKSVEYDPQQIQLWCNQIQIMVNEFTEGVASVSPQDRNLSCAYCDLHPLCRIDSHE